ncbi:hypothetical protein P3W85_00705 [Cupriavidus basilensis]|uniref:Uncharacterized protein n=1 Tax=Cupriavidus basilensis TaxID=68895 RepID=A0ABT6AGA2_9BURK|nr:hypothetical protein [Cupriavidus basilensis]MDF3831489.1 hypothetical protein [Cupriavidus basilensis]
MRLISFLALVLVSGAANAQLYGYKAAGSTGYGGYASSSQQRSSTAYGSSGQSQGTASLSGVNGAITQRYSNATSGHKLSDMSSAEDGDSARRYGGYGSTARSGASTGDGSAQSHR